MRILAPSAAGHAGDAGSLLYKTLLFCPLCFCCGWLACCAVLAFFALVFGPSGARARATPGTKRCYLQCFVAFAFPGWLVGCSFLAAVSGASGARARATPCQPSGLGPGWGPESWHPRHHLGLGWATCRTQPAIAQHRIRFSHKKHDMTWYNFKEA